MERQDTFFDKLEKKYRSLTKKQLRLANFFRYNYKTAVFMACVPLAREVGVSEATVVRFANALGYEGFTEMMHHIRDYMKNELNTIDKVKGLESAYKHTNIAAGIAEENIKSIRNLCKILVQDTINRIVEDMTKCKKLILIGFEGSAGLMEYLGYHMVRTGCQVEVVTEKYGNTFDLVNSTDAGSFVITVAFPRYARAQLKLGEMLNALGATILAVTDSLKSPLLGSSSYSILIPINTAYNSNIDVYAAVLSLFQILIFEYGKKNYDNVRKSLDKLEEFNTYFDIFKKK
jgi:DNA-binding MurR/RpiR family transcriptional regulator